MVIGSRGKCEAVARSGSLAEIAKDAEEGWVQNLCGEVRE